MKEKPILFSTPMVQSILENRKTMTRRTAGLEKVNVAPNSWELEKISQVKCDNRSYLMAEFQGVLGEGDWMTAFTKYNIGDRLWVRESYRYAFHYGFTDELIEYKAGGTNCGCKIIDTDQLIPSSKWKPSIHMFKEYARIWLECTNVRCERLQSITEADAIAEGIDYKIGFALCKNPERNMCQEPLTESFFVLWKKLNGEKSVALNPWVFIYEFKRIKKPCQQPQN